MIERTFFEIRGEDLGDFSRFLGSKKEWKRLKLLWNDLENHLKKADKIRVIIISF